MAPPLRIASILCFTWLALLFVQPCAAQAPPPTPTGDDSETIRPWAEYWCNQLLTKDANQADVERARTELLRKFTGPQIAGSGPSLAYRTNFSGAVVSRLEAGLDDASLHAAANIMRVLQPIGTDRALSVLVQRVNPATETRWQVRLAASHALVEAIKVIVRAPDGVNLPDRPGLVEPRKIADAAERMRDAAAAEQRTDILVNLVTAMTVADTVPVPSANRAEIRTAILGALGDMVDRMGESQEPSPLIEPAYVAVAGLRNIYLKLTGEEQRSTGEMTGPSLGSLLEAAKTHPDASVDPHLPKLYGDTVKACEEFLKVIDVQVRGDGKAPKTDLRRAWEQPDRTKYDADLALWLEVVGQPPYRQPAT